MNMNMFLWIMTPHKLVGTYQRLGETYCLNFQGLRFEANNSMIIRDVGINLRVHTALRRKRPTMTSHRLFPSDLFKIAVFWIVAHCNLVELYRLFIGAYCLHR